jgi:predicted AAA+ superfamily ATPase
MTLKEFLVYGGYPGSYQLKENRIDWLDYIKYSIIDPVIGKDILSLVHVKSPALFKQCFELICSYAAQEISYTKLLGQLQDKGNTDLVKHYIELFEAAFLIKSLHKYSGKEIKRRASSPKIIPLCPALYSVTKDADYSDEDFGHAFEVVIGAYLNSLPGKLYYWRERNYEVDFVYQFGKKLWAIEVKYGQMRSLKGLEKFLERFPSASTYVVTPNNFQEFFKTISTD